MFSKPLTSSHKFILQKFSEKRAIELNFRILTFLLMEMILDALNFNYVDKSRGKWPNIDNICYVATFHSPNRQHN